MVSDKFNSVFWTKIKVYRGNANTHFSLVWSVVPEANILSFFCYKNFGGFLFKCKRFISNLFFSKALAKSAYSRNYFAHELCYQSSSKSATFNSSLSLSLVIFFFRRNVCFQRNMIYSHFSFYENFVSSFFIFIETWANLELFSFIFQELK